MEEAVPAPAPPSEAPAEAPPAAHLELPATAAASVVQPSDEAIPQPEPTAAAAGAAAAGGGAAAPVERARKKRKLEEVGFHSSSYYRIRKIVRKLRPAFLQLLQLPDFRGTAVAADILKEIKTVLELSKQLRSDLAAITEPRKASSIPPAKDEPNEAFPPTHQAENVIAVPNSNNNISCEEVGVEPKDVPFNLDDGLKGSYVVGGSPVGWNFLVYPGSKPVYYGRSKAEKQTHQIEV